MEEDLKPSPQKTSPRKSQGGRTPHQVIHFESPPRTRLRERLEQEAEKIKKGRIFANLIVVNENKKKPRKPKPSRNQSYIKDSELDKYKKLGERRKQVSK